MRHGITIFPTDRSIGIVELARAVEERGLDSLWLPEHTHIPTSRRTPWPVAPDQPIDDKYKRSLDPLVTLAAAAVATEQLRLGTGILLVAQRDPIVTAKALASVDHLSGGRLAVGIGFGWNEDEMEHHGVDYKRRRARAREHVLAMRALWEEDEAEFHGELVDFSPSWQWPKPAQRPLPVVIGGAAGPKLFHHIAEYAQGWIPIGGAGLRDAIPRLRDAAVEAGRPDDEVGALEIVPMAVQPDAGKLEFYESIGVTEAVFDLPSAPADVVLPVLDRYAALVEVTAR
ncbi:MAG: LLM class F420-dependent oxidoreductase [Acidimicrobiia bacterium]|nr:LLM class F420-dependent oxidoreductase [Acidimicrobiia bacterium]